MAIQMLYQNEQGGATLDQVFEAFDLEDYVSEMHIAQAEAEAAKAEVVEAAAEESGTHRGIAAPEIAKSPPAAPPSVSGTAIAASFEYARKLVKGTLEHGSSIDDLIRRHAENWRLERMPSIDRNILRLALYEMLFEEHVPKVVIVDEAIELAKRFGSENSGRFVNGLLDGVLKSKAAP